MNLKLFLWKFCVKKKEKSVEGKPHVRPPNLQVWLKKGGYFRPPKVVPVQLLKVVFLATYKRPSARKWESFSLHFRAEVTPCLLWVLLLFFLQSSYKIYEFSLFLKIWAWIQVFELWRPPKNVLPHRHVGFAVTLRSPRGKLDPCLFYVLMKF